MAGENRAPTLSHINGPNCNTMLSCAYCNDERGEVVAIGCCAAKCSVGAHRACVGARKSSAVYRKKHHHRSNLGGELCPVPGCVAKFEPRLRSEGKRADDVQQERAGSAKTRSTVQPAATENNVCTFFRRDGLPCTREATRDGACPQHQHQAALLRQMTAPEETTPKDRCEVGTQTDDFALENEIRARILEEMRLVMSQAFDVLERE